MLYVKCMNELQKDLHRRLVSSWNGSGSDGMHWDFVPHGSDAVMRPQKEQNKTMKLR